MLALVAAFWASFLVVATTAGIKRTVDDTEGGSVSETLPLYSPEWNVGQECPGCHSQPDQSKVFRGTWHDTTQDDPNAPGARSTDPRNVTIVFPGTAVTVYAVLNNQKMAYDTTATYLDFSINGTKVGSYDHQPTSDVTDYIYDVPVYTNSALPNGTHTITIALVATHGSSLFLFDYLEYIYEPPAPILSSASSSPTSSTSTSTPPFTTAPMITAPSSTAPSMASTFSSSSTPASFPPPPATPSTIPNLQKSYPKTPIGAIIGGVVASFVVVFIFLALLLFRRRRAKAHARSVELLKLLQSASAAAPHRSSAVHFDPTSPSASRNAQTTRNPLPEFLTHPENDAMTLTLGQSRLAVLSLTAGGSSVQPTIPAVLRRGYLRKNPEPDRRRSGGTNGESEFGRASQTPEEPPPPYPPPPYPGCSSR